jgi:ketosteroid isomerase-like protein
MSVELVRELDDAVERRDVQAFMARCHADVVWEHNLGGGSPEEGVYEGREQMTQLFERILGGFEDMRTRALEVSEIDTDVYLVRGELNVKVADSEAVIVEPYEQRLEFHDGLLVKGRMAFGSALVADHQERKA